MAIWNITDPQAEVLLAYRDDGTHTRSIEVTSRLVHLEFLGGSQTPPPGLVITQKGRDALAQWEARKAAAKKGKRKA